MVTSAAHAKTSSAKYRYSWFRDVRPFWLLNNIKIYIQVARSKRLFKRHAQSPNIMATPQHLQNNVNSDKSEDAGNNTAATDANPRVMNSNTNTSKSQANTVAATTPGATPVTSNSLSTGNLDKDPLFSYHALDESMNEADLQALRAGEDGEEDFPSLFWDYMDDSNSNINLSNGNLYANGVIDAVLNTSLNAGPLPSLNAGALEPPPASAGPACNGTHPTPSPSSTIKYETSLVQNPLQPNATAASGLFTGSTTSNVATGPGTNIGGVGGTPIAPAPATLGVILNGGVNAVTPTPAPAVNFDFSAPGFLAELAQQIAANGAANNQSNLNMNFAAPVQQAFLPNVNVGNAGVGNLNVANGNVGLVNVAGVNNYPFLLPSMVNLANGPTNGTPVAPVTGAPSGAPDSNAPGPESASSTTNATSAPVTGAPYTSSPVLLSNVWNAAAATPVGALANNPNATASSTNSSQGPVTSQPQALAPTNSTHSLQAANGNGTTSSSSVTSNNRSLSNLAAQSNAQFYGLPPPPSTLGIQSIPPGMSLTTQQAQQLQATQQNVFLQQIQQPQQQQQQQQQQQTHQQQIRQQFDSLMSLNLATAGAMPPPQQQMQMRTISNAAQAGTQILPMPQGGGGGAAQSQVIPQTPTSTDGAVLANPGQVPQHNDSSSTNPGANAPASSSNLRRPPLAPNTSVPGNRKRSVTRTITNILPATSNFISSSDTDESHTAKGAGTGGKKRKVVVKTRKGSDVSIVPTVTTATNGLGGGLGVNVAVPLGLTVSNMPFGSLASAVSMGNSAPSHNGMMPTNITSMPNVKSRATSGPVGKKRKVTSGMNKVTSNDSNKKCEELADGADMEMTEEERQLANRLRNREHARNTRARKKAYLETLKSTLEELCQERDTDASERARAASLLLEMQKTRTDVLLHFFALRANNETRRQLWASILEESVTTVMPVTPYRSFPASEVQVSKCQRTVMGVDGMIADASSLHVLLNSLVDRSRFPEGKVKFQYTLVAEEAVVSGNQMMARWSMTTINARSLGSRREVSKMGMLCARFSSAHKIVSLEIMFDVMAFMLQLKQGTNLQAFTVVPNTVHTCHGPFGDAAMVMTLAERPYTIVQVNSQWEKMTGWKAEDVVGKASCKILQGEKTEKNELEELMGNIRYKRPSFTVLTNYTRGHDKSFRNFLTLYPLSTDSKITHYVGLTTHKTWLDGGTNDTKGKKDQLAKAEDSDSTPKSTDPSSCKAKAEANGVKTS